MKKSVAILGGGISGLSSAYYLLRKSLSKGLNLDRVYLLEESSRFGGWLHSKPIENVPNQTRVNQSNYFELGPRTISLNSYAGINVLALVNSLGLSAQTKSIPKQSLSFKRRYIIIDDKLRLLPNSFRDLIVAEKPFRPFIAYLLQDLRRPRLRLNSESGDVSVHEFFQYRFGDDIANYLINPLCIGITGGDSRLLSMRSVFPSILKKEQTYGSVVRGMFAKEDIWKDLKTDSLVAESIRDKWAVFSFEKGIETLPKKLLSTLQEEFGSKIIVKPCTKVIGLRFNENGKNVVSAENDIDLEVDHIFSSIKANSLARLLPSRYGLLKQTLESIETVSMAVVCLQFDETLIPIDKGFGFLIPSSEKSDILGVTFDSCIFPKPSTQVTVMLGGCWFKQLFGSTSNVDHKHLLQISLKALDRYLQIRKQPSHSHIAIHEDCIPQYHVGHHKKLQIIENEIRDLNLSLLGSSYYGFSVPDTILSAKTKSEQWIQSELDEHSN
ncbi:Protoporphyrinogen oxidase [Sarcoptes scabiei]|uniref:Protoporphyrinogen oxidase n=1 Tax=Sarcoptes scabiei TaxID=52283 RepID=A0A834VE66_SARSC|nr:Protoporphyrinogen oxidase [Sarcoptes scabiei]